MGTIIKTPKVARSFGMKLGDSSVLFNMPIDSLPKVTPEDDVPLTGILIKSGLKQEGLKFTNKFIKTGPMNPGSFGRAIAEGNAKAGRAKLAHILSHGVQVTQKSEVKRDPMSQSERNCEYSLFTQTNLVTIARQAGCDDVVLYNPNFGTLKRLLQCNQDCRIMLADADDAYRKRLRSILDSAGSTTKFEEVVYDKRLMYYTSFTRHPKLDELQLPIICFQPNVAKMTFYGRDVTSVNEEEDGYKFTISKTTRSETYFKKKHDNRITYPADVLTDFFSKGVKSKPSRHGYDANMIIYHDMILSGHQVLFPTHSKFTKNKLCPLDAWFLVADNVYVKGHEVHYTDQNQTSHVIMVGVGRGGYADIPPGFVPVNDNLVDFKTSLATRATVMMSPHTSMIAIMNQKYTYKDGKLSSIFDSGGVVVEEHHLGDKRVGMKRYITTGDVPIMTKTHDWFNSRAVAHNYRDRMNKMVFSIDTELEDYIETSSQIT